LQRVRDAYEGCEFVFPRDIDVGKVEAYLADRRRKPRREGGLSVQTSNFYLAAVSQFCRWMVKRRRMAENPMLEARRGNVKLDRRHDRRDLKPEELSHLLDVVRASEWSFRGMGPEDRYWLYLTSCGTGFRKGELYSLTPESFALDSEPPAVTIAAEFTKNKRPVTQPLPARLVAGLREYLQGKQSGARVWPGSWPDRAADMLKHDLAAAGIPYAVKGPDGSLYADFHALRHTYVTFLERAGASVKEAQGLARHGDIRLTMDRYTHSDRQALARAADRLPLPGGGEEGQTPDPAQVAAAFLLMRTVLSYLVAPWVAPNIETPGDARESEGTDGGGNVAA
jgi:integrase